MPTPVLALSLLFAATPAAAAPDLAPVVEATRATFDVPGIAVAIVKDGEEEPAGVVLSRTADEAWLARYQRKGLSDVALKVLGSGPSVWFATVPGDGDVPAAIGRCVVDGRWAGFAAVEVDPALRRRGLASAVMAALAGRALEEGASAAWLQVEADNTGARALYAGMGFAAHHAYHHYREPGNSSGSGR